MRDLVRRVEQNQKTTAELLLEIEKDEKEMDRELEEPMRRAEMANQKVAGMAEIYEPEVTSDRLNIAQMQSLEVVPETRVSEPMIGEGENNMTIGVLETPSGETTDKYEVTSQSVQETGANLQEMDTFDAEIQEIKTNIRQGKRYRQFV